VGLSEPAMEPQTLSRELQARGLELLGVGRHATNPEVLVVYLHGNAGQWQDGTARMLIASVPGVITVTESLQSPAILLVWTGIGTVDESAHGNLSDDHSDDPESDPCR
jgi:hypothetical protein